MIVKIIVFFLNFSKQSFYIIIVRRFEIMTFYITKDTFTVNKVKMTKFNIDTTILDLDRKLPEAGTELIVVGGRKLPKGTIVTFEGWKENRNGMVDILGNYINPSCCVNFDGKKYWVQGRFLQFANAPANAVDSFEANNFAEARAIYMESGYESSKSFAYLEGETICQVNCSISQYNTSVKDGMISDMGDKLAMVGYNWVRDQYAFIVIDKDVKPGNIVKWEYFGSPLQNGGDNNGFVEATDEYQRYIA